MGFPGGGAKWQVSTNGGEFARWRRDGRELFFLGPGDDMMAVDVTSSAKSIRLGTPHALFDVAAIERSLGPYDVAADGKKFLINAGDVNEESRPLTLVLNWTAELKK
jgi:eukaryotic-like serine/threonine-protein kinase